MKHKFYTLFIILIFASYSATCQNKATAIKTFTNKPMFKHASIGICVKKLSGETIASLNEDKTYTPASIMKLITTATAIESLGANFRYETTLAIDENNSNQLIIHGYGDPTLGSEKMDNSTDFLNTWTEKIEAKLDRNKKTNILVVDNYFGYEGLPERWIRQDIGNYYATITHGISIFDNMYRIYFNTLNTSIPKIIKTEPKLKNIQFINQLSLNTTGRDNGYILGDPYSNTRLLTGNIPAKRSAFMIKGAIFNPGQTLGEAVADKLSEKGISIESIKTSQEEYFSNRGANRAPSWSEQIFYRHRSQALSDIIREINVKSNNHYAEHLLHTLGRVKNRDIYSSSLHEGVDYIKAFWRDRGLDTTSLFMYDGCGLAPSSGVSAKFLCSLLVKMQKGKNAEIFLNSLPEAGKDGTVRNFLKGTRLAGKVHVKSGSIAAVRCFAGYYIDGENKYAFVVMVNKFDSPSYQVTKAIETLLLNIF